MVVLKHSDKNSEDGNIAVIIGNENGKERQIY